MTAEARPSTAPADLERSLGLPSVIALGISAMLGSGIFVLPGLASGIAGHALWLAYVLAGLCFLPAALCKSELATAMPVAGGSYVYLDRIFGPMLGTIAGVALWLAMVLKSSFALLGFGTYLAVLGDFPLKVAVLACLALIIVINLVGVKRVSQVQMVVVSCAIGAMVLMIIWGLPSVRLTKVAPIFPGGITDTFVAAAFVFIAFNGVTKVAAIAEEVRQPERNIPRGILFCLFFVMGAYALTAFVLTGNIPAEELATDLHPLYTLADKLWGHGPGLAIAVLGVVTMTSMANGGLLAASRFVFAMSRESLLPPVLHRISARYRTPGPAIVVTGIVMAVVVVFLDLAGIAKLASAVVVMIGVAENIAVVVFRESGVGWYKPNYRAPFYPWVQILGVIAGVLLIIGLGWSGLAGIVLGALPGALLYVTYGRSRTRRQGVLSGRLRRPDLFRVETARKAPQSSKAVVVGLFGAERSPEMLVELGVALAGTGGVEAMLVTEVPEQTGLDASLATDEPHLRSMQRRIRAMAEERGLSIEIHTAVSRDLLRTVHDETRRAQCEWLVLRWQGRDKHQLLPKNPLGWLVNHLDANLALYRDAGVRYVREILVYAEPGPNDALVVRTAEHLASIWTARVTLGRFAPDGASPTALQAETDYLEQLGQLCEAKHSTRILRGQQPAESVIEATASYDLVVLGARDRRLLQTLRGSFQDRIATRAACSVLIVKSARVKTHEAYERLSRNSEASLPDLLRPAAVGAKLDVSKKEVLFEQLADHLVRVVPGVTSRRIVEALWERERTQNTAVGNGVALPHATITEASRSVLAVFTSAGGVQYQGPDREACDVFFVTLGPPSERERHLKVLSAIARLCTQTNVIVALRGAESGDAVRATFERCVRQIKE